MGLLTPDQVVDMAFAHRKIFEAVCDDCGHCIPVGTLYIVLKYQKNKWPGPGPKPHTWNNRVPKKIRCIDCNKLIFGDIQPRSKIKLKGKGKKRVSPEEIAKVNVDVKKLAIRMLKKSEEPIETKNFKLKLFLKARKIDSKIKKSSVNATLRVLKKARMLKMSKGVWSLPES